ncbi:MAG TPA: energy transducer TonB [Hyphomicrobium sp.]|jgi:protein TonB
MQLLRPTTWLLSFGLHAGLVLAIVGVTTGGAALDAGSGSDTFVVEQGIALEGVTKFGEAEEMIETVDIPPVQEMTEPKPVEEIKPELTDVLTSSESEHEEQVVAEEPKPIEEEKPVATPVEQQAPQVATLIEQSSGAAQEGGDTTLLLAYRGTVRKALERSKVNPRSRVSGTVLVKFTVGPSGQLLSRQVEKSSGSKLLDDAAMNAVERAAPFPPMPKEFAGEPMEMKVPYRFVTR